ncbi:MAG: hypothetical protein ACI4XM_07740 [Candidatus Coprovivens sp.]
MNFKHIRNCLTCEFGFDNSSYDEEFNPVMPDNLVIKCAGNTELYGKEVSYKSRCEFWSVSLEEFSRVKEGIGYHDYYKKYLDLLER